MDGYFLIAGILAVFVGLVHSVLGEVLIFRHLRQSHWIPTQSPPPLTERHIRIIWATWHLASVFGFVLAAVLFALASPSLDFKSVTVHSIAVGFLLASLLVLVATKGKHPGWIGLLLVSVCLWLAEVF